MLNIINTEICRAHSGYDHGKKPSDAEEIEYRWEEPTEYQPGGWVETDQSLIKRMKNHYGIN